jgi:hypothetical protein
MLRQESYTGGQNGDNVDDFEKSCKSGITSTCALSSVG